MAFDPGGAVPPDRPHIERAPYDPVDPPRRIERYFCPACGMEVRGRYNLEYARKRCTKTWHKAAPVKAVYVLAPSDDELVEVNGHLEDWTAVTSNENGVEAMALNDAGEALAVDLSRLAGRAR